MNNTLGEEYDSGGARIVTTASDYANRLNEVQLKDFNWKQLSSYGYSLGVCIHISQSKSGVLCNPSEFGWGGATAIIDLEIMLGVFYAQHVQNPREEYYQPRMKNVIYSCLK